MGWRQGSSTCGKPKQQDSIRFVISCHHHEHSSQHCQIHLAEPQQRCLKSCCYIQLDNTPTLHTKNFTTSIRCKQRARCATPTPPPASCLSGLSVLTHMNQHIPTLLSHDTATSPLPPATWVQGSSRNRPLPPALHMMLQLVPRMSASLFLSSPRTSSS